MQLQQIQPQYGLSSWPAKERFSPASIHFLQLILQCNTADNSRFCRSSSRDLSLHFAAFDLAKRDCNAT